MSEPEEIPMTGQDETILDTFRAIDDIAQVLPGTGATVYSSQDNIGNISIHQVCNTVKLKTVFLIFSFIMIQSFFFILDFYLFEICFYDVFLQLHCMIFF